MITAGDLLISPPGMPDHRFNKTVMFVANHSNTSMAFCLNRKTKFNLSNVLSEINLNINLDNDTQLYWGGPVFTNTVWLLHDNTWQHDASIEINKHWSMTSHQSMFNDIAQGNLPDRYRIFFGCASWGPGQLESEIEGEPPWSKNQSWLILNNPDPDWLLTCEIDDLWIYSTDLCSKKAVDQWIP
jgi:putative transcriptional regulator